MNVDGMIQAVRDAATMEAMVAALRGGPAGSGQGSGGGIRLYHGTAKGNTFSRFDPSRAGTGVGKNSADQGDRTYLTESLPAARWFAEKAEVVRQLMDGGNPGLNDENPGTVLAFTLDASAQVLHKMAMPRGAKSKEVIQQAADAGFDAIAFPDQGFNTVEGDPRVADMLEGGTPPTTYIILNEDKLTAGGEVGGEAGGPASGARGEAGKHLTPEQRRDTLATLVDVYREKGLSKEPRVNERGEEYYAYPHSPDLFETSDITGRRVRYHVTLPDGRLAHPTELFPDLTEARVEAMAAEQASSAEQVDKELDRHLATTFATMAEAVRHWDDKSDASLAQHGRRAVVDSLNRAPVTDGERVALIPSHVLRARLAEIEAKGWRRGEPEASGDTLLTSYSEEELAERERAQQAAQEAEQRQREEAERRAQADRDRDDFRLSGSNSASDVAASYGQSDMLGAAMSPPAGGDMFGASGQVEPDPFPGPKGREMEVRTAKGTRVDTQFTVIEAADLIASHTPDGRQNAAFPQELQPRDRSRDSSRAWIQKVAKDLDPGLLGKTKKADSGAPIVGKDRIVESGNGRTLAIMEAYRLGHAGEYKAWLVEDAASYGLEPSQIARMEAPVLVRVRTSNIDRAEFAVEANQDDKLAMTATEKAKADANRLTPELMARFDPGADGDLLTASNRDFIQGFLRSLGDAEAAQYLTSTGEFTGPLIARIQAAVFAKAYEDERLLELMADSAKPENRNIISALSAAAPEFIRARAANSDAAQDASEKLAESVELSLENEAVKSLIDATNIVRQAKREGMDVGEYVSQMGLFGDVEPGVAAMAVFIAQNNRSARRLSTAFKAMAEFVRAELERGQAAAGDMFGEAAKVSMADVVEAANRVMEREYGEAHRIDTPSPGGLFESATPSPDLLSVDIDAAAAVTDLTPTPAQAESGNYRKGKVTVHGLTIAIENPKDSVRRGVDQDGQAWESTLAHHYGDIKGTVGADGDSIDVFLGDSPASTEVYVIDQVGPDGRFDEHKVMIGFESLEAARAGYLANYEDGWQGMGEITRASLSGFKAWLRSGNTRRPFHEQKPGRGIYEGVERIRRRALERYLLLG